MIISKRGFPLDVLENCRYFSTWDDYIICVHCNMIAMTEFCRGFEVFVAVVLYMTDVSEVFTPCSKDCSDTTRKVLPPSAG